LIIYDPELVTINDLGSNFYTTPAHVGKVSRAEASAPQLRELNPYVTVKIYDKDPTPENLSDFDVVIITDNWDRSYLSAVG